MSVPQRVHVVGAGIAGLAAAVTLAEAGSAVALYEAAPQAGGRCRSYLDAALGCRIDNGNHLLLSGNRAAMRYIEMIGRRGKLTGPERAIFPFLDRATGERWVLRPNAGRIPWWLFDQRAPRRRAPARSTISKRGDCSKADACGRHGSCQIRSTLFRRLWQPLAVAALNTEVEAGAAKLFGTVVRETLGAGGSACMPLVPREGLSESLVEPAMLRLRARGAAIRFGTRLRAIAFTKERVAELDFDGGANSSPRMRRSCSPCRPRSQPGCCPISPCRTTIARLSMRITALPLRADMPWFIGLIGGVAEWVFRKPEVLSVTVSAADRLVDVPAAELPPCCGRMSLLPTGCARADAGLADRQGKASDLRCDAGADRRRPGAATRGATSPWPATGPPRPARDHRRRNSLRL